MPSRTPVDRRHLMRLNKQQLVDVLWLIVKDASEAAEANTDHSPEQQGRDMCVLSPNTILEPVEEATGRFYEPPRRR